MGFDQTKPYNLSCLVGCIDLHLISLILGPTLSNALVNAGITSFQKIEETNPRELELVACLFLLNALFMLVDNNFYVFIFCYVFIIFKYI